MTDLLLRIGATKLVVSLVLACLAWVARRRGAHPSVTHPLWLLVLVALLLPAVVSVPVPSGTIGTASVATDDPQSAVQANARLSAQSGGIEDAGSGTSFPGRFDGNARTGVTTVWLSVTALLLGWTLVRTLRFRRLLARTTQAAPPGLGHEVSRIGRGLGLVHRPEVHITTARVSPMVCWTGGKVRLVVPSFLLAELDHRELRAVLAHELAHVRRRDHLVRWIEWLACSVFWWNPVAWWARRELRAAEEASCDALGVVATGSTPRAYAQSLLQVLEVMSKPPTPPTPTLASGVASGRGSRSIERRLRMLVTGRSTRRAPGWIRAMTIAGAAFLLPLGLVYCGPGTGTTPTEPEEPPVPPQGATLAFVTGSDGSDSSAAEPKELMRGDPVYAYWTFGTPGMAGPRPLREAPVHPAECRMDPEERDEQALDEAMAACAKALARGLPRTEGFEDRNVCVQREYRTDLRWRGICEGWEPDERYRVRGNGTGSFLLQRIGAGSGR